MATLPVDCVPSMTFAALAAHDAWLCHGFLLRQTGVDVQADRGEALSRLGERHGEAVRTLGFAASDVASAEQVHGAQVARVDGGGTRVPGVDGLISAAPGCLLGIYVADCCAVYLVDPVRRAIGLVHSGRKGSEQGIVREAIAAMGREFHSAPGDLVVQLSPCIRPPRYEVDIAAMIRRDALEAGVSAAQIHDSGVCTGSDLGRFYSYRVEKGRTGRMFALLGLGREKHSQDTHCGPS